MSIEEQIRQALSSYIKRINPDATVLGTVKSVDETAATCTVWDEDSQTTLYDVRLRPTLDGNKSITLIPAFNTWALAVRIEDSEDWMVLAVGELAKYFITCSNVVINDGQNGGLVNWPDAKTELDKVKQFITAFKNCLSVPVSEAGGGAPSAFQAAMNSAMSSTAVPSFENLEDPKVKH